MADLLAPEASLVMALCNQAGICEAAVRSALAQTDIRLEIILSDDASDDGTLAVLERLAAGYAGPHQVRVRANPQRLWRDHFSLLAREAAASFVIMAHGDDAMRPDRCARLLAEHRRTGAAMVLSSVRQVDAAGRELGVMRPTPLDFTSADGFVALLSGASAPGYVGAAMGWDRRLFEAFPPLDRRYCPFGHDYLLTFRAGLIGGVTVVDEPLVTYRVEAGRRRPEDEPTLPGEVEVIRFADLAFAAAALSDLDHFEGLGGAAPVGLRERITAICLSRLRAYMACRGELDLEFRPTWLPRAAHRALVERQPWLQARWFVRWLGQAINGRLSRLTRR